ncbi:MAG: PD-(D/E)XK nuclease family protein [Candidatus Kapabacteria bacterium]|jgi:ATP-dependent helicase/nuclease subunit B|nr:PD-(D/E)XK nuclease family protein [Candidatus Kapabacteria bacterium]
MYVLHNRRPSRFDLDAPLEVILEQEIAANAHEALQSVVCIVPTGRRVRLLRRSITRAVFGQTGKPVSDVQIFTLEGFVRHLANLLLGNAQPHLASEALTAAIMEEASERCRRDMTFFTSGGSRFQAISPAVLERLQSIILGLKEDGITPKSLRADLMASGLGPGSDVTDPRRLADIATLYESYERTLGDAVTDYPKLLTLITDSLTKEHGTPNLRTESSIEVAWKTVLPNATTLVLDGFTEFKKPEERFLAALYYAPFHSRIILDYSDANGPLFGGLQDTVASLQGFSGKPVAEKDGKTPDEISLVPRYTAFTTDTAANDRFKERREEHLPKASYLRRWLFNTEEDIRHEGFNDAVRIVAFDNRADEVRSIAKLLRYFALKENIPLAEMCVVMRQPEQYSSLFREMFALYDIPANITDRFPLEKSPVVTAVFAVLDMLLYGYKREDVNRALQSPYLRFERKERGYKKYAPLNAANLFTVAGRLRISGGRRFGRDGKTQWQRRMDSRLAYLSKREIMLNRDQNADRDELAETRRFIEEIELAKRDFTALLALFPEEQSQLTPREFSEFINDAILAKLRVHDQIVAFHNHARGLASEGQSDSNAKRMTEFLSLEEEVEKDARALASFLKILEEFTAILQERDTRAHRANTSLPPERPRSLEEYIERLRTAVRSGRYQVREKLGYGVTVTAAEQIRGVPFRLTVICGAVDGEFPGRYVPETFLGKELVDSEERFLRKERVQFYQALTNNAPLLESGGKRVFITYPSRADNGDDLTRSSFVDALLKITSLQEAGCVVSQELRLTASQASMRPTPSPQAPSNQASNDQVTNDLEPWLHSSLFGLASEEETVRAAALKYVKALPEERSQVIEAFVGEMEREDAKAALMRVREHLDAVLSQSETAAKDVHVEGERLAKTAYSISALEQYAKCPYQFFAAKTLRLREIQEYDTSLSPLESGSLLHRILYKFYQELQQEQRETAFVVKPIQSGLPDLITVQLEASERERYRRLLHSIAEEELKVIRFDHPFFDLDREAILGQIPIPQAPNNQEQNLQAPSNQEPSNQEPSNQEYTRRGKLDIWLDSELARAEGKDGKAAWLFAPALFEFAFGELKSALGNVELAENVRLHGKIDRIEILPSETPDKPHQIMVGDYKSGASVATNGDIKKGLSLQMPLYSVAAEQMLREGYGIETETAGAVYYILSPKTAKRGEDAETHSFVLLPKESPLAPERQTKNGGTVADAETMRSMIDHSTEKASEYATHIGNGYFPVEPQKRGGFVPCEYCDFKPVCRVSEMQ